MKKEKNNYSRKATKIYIYIYKGNSFLRNEKAKKKKNIYIKKGERNI